MNILRLPYLLVVTIAAFTLSVSTAFAEDVAYVATLNGVECDGCKKTISRSFAKIEGVTMIRIVKNKDGSHTMTVTTDGTRTISKQAATEAIKHAEHYRIKTWSVAEPAAS